MGWGGWTFDFDNTAYLLYHSGQFWNPYIKDQKLDGMLEAQRAIMDRDKRQAILRDATPAGLRRAGLADRHPAQREAIRASSQSSGTPST